MKPRMQDLHCLVMQLPHSILDILVTGGKQLRLSVEQDGLAFRLTLPCDKQVSRRAADGEDVGSNAQPSRGTRCVRWQKRCTAK